MDPISPPAPKNTCPKSISLTISCAVRGESGISRIHCVTCHRVQTPVNTPERRRGAFVIFVRWTNALLKKHVFFVFRAFYIVPWKHGSTNFLFEKFHKITRLNLRIFSLENSSKSLALHRHTRGFTPCSAPKNQDTTR